MTNLFSYPLHILTKKLRLISTLILSRLVLISLYSYILYCCYLGVLFLKTLKQLEYLNLQNLPGVEDPRYIICTQLSHWLTFMHQYFLKSEVLNELPFFVCKFLTIWFVAALRIHLIFAWIRILGSTLGNSGSGSATLVWQLSVLNNLCIPIVIIHFEFLCYQERFL